MVLDVFFIFIIFNLNHKNRDDYFPIGCENGTNVSCIGCENGPLVPDGKVVLYTLMNSSFIMIASGCCTSTISEAKRHQPRWLDANQDACILAKSYHLPSIRAC